MPAPIDYTVAQPQVSSYFEAIRQGRADRQAVEGERRKNALSKYLPGALKGDETQRQQALSAAADDPDRMIALNNVFQGMDARQLQDTKEKQGRLASLAAWADTPEKWAIANQEAKKIFPNAPDLPFEQREMVIAKAQTLAEQIDQAHREKAFGLQERQFAESGRHNRAMEANAANRFGGAGSKPPAGYRYVQGADGSLSLEPIPGGPADKTQKPLPPRVSGEFEKLGDQAGEVRSAEGSFKDDYASQGVFGVGGDTALWLGRNVPAVPGGASQYAVDWWQRYDRYKNVVRNDLFGAALTPSEQAAFEKADINSNMSAPTIRENLKTQGRIINGAIGRRTRAAGAQGYNMEAINELTGGYEPTPNSSDVVPDWAR